jgi:hypothetical protein
VTRVAGWTDDSSSIDALTQLIQLESVAGFLPLRRQESQMSRQREVLIGRSLAALVHPVAAWRAFSRPGRLLLALGYSAAAYITTLSALLAF